MSAQNGSRAFRNVHRVATTVVAFVLLFLLVWVEDLRARMAIHEREQVTHRELRDAEQRISKGIPPGWFENKVDKIERDVKELPTMRVQLGEILRRLTLLEQKK